MIDLRLGDCVEVDDEFKLLSGEIVGVITKEQYERAVYRV